MRVCDVVNVFSQVFLRTNFIIVLCYIYIYVVNWTAVLRVYNFSLTLYQKTLLKRKWPNCLKITHIIFIKHFWTPCLRTRLPSGEVFPLPYISSFKT